MQVGPEGQEPEEGGQNVLALRGPGHRLVVVAVVAEGGHGLAQQ